MTATTVGRVIGGAFAASIAVALVLVLPSMVDPVEEEWPGGCGLVILAEFAILILAMVLGLVVGAWRRGAARFSKARFWAR